MNHITIRILESAFYLVAFAVVMLLAWPFLLVARLSDARPRYPLTEKSDVPCNIGAVYALVCSKAEAAEEQGEFQAAARLRSEADRMTRGVVA